MADYKIIDESEDPFKPEPVPVDHYSIERLQMIADSMNAYMYDSLRLRDRSKLPMANPVEYKDKKNTIGLFLYGYKVHEWDYFETTDPLYMRDEMRRFVDVIEKASKAAVLSLMRSVDVEF